MDPLTYVTWSTISVEAAGMHVKNRSSRKLRNPDVYRVPIIGSPDSGPVHNLNLDDCQSLIGQSDVPNPSEHSPSPNWPPWAVVLLFRRVFVFPCLSQSLLEHSLGNATMDPNALAATLDGSVTVRIPLTVLFFLSLAHILFLPSFPTLNYMRAYISLYGVPSLPATFPFGLNPQ